MNKQRRHPRLTRKDVSLAVAGLMPHIMRGIQLDFFIKRGVTQTQFLLLASIRAYGRPSTGSGRPSRASLDSHSLARDSAERSRGTQSRDAAGRRRSAQPLGR